MKRLLGNLRDRFSGRSFAGAFDVGYLSVGREVAVLAAVITLPLMVFYPVGHAYSRYRRQQRQKRKQEQARLAPPAIPWSERDRDELG